MSPLAFVVMVSFVGVAMAGPDFPIVKVRDNRGADVLADLL